MHVLDGWVTLALGAVAAASPKDLQKSLLCCAVPAPPFQNPKCDGQVIRNQTVRLGCVPLSPAILQDFQDFVNFLAGRLLPPSIRTEN